MKKFSLVTYLTGDVYVKVRGLQEKMSELTGSRKCLTDWQPHITIGDGPLLTDEQIPEFEEKLKAFAKQQKPMIARITGSGGIDNWKGAIEGEISPFVIWLTVDVSPDLQRCWEVFRDTITSRYPTWLPRSQSYMPHVTIAFADLTEEGYRKGMAYLESLNLDLPFFIEHIAMAECYGIGNMTSSEYKRFELRGS